MNPNSDVFNLAIPTEIPGIPAELVDPVKAWSDSNSFDVERIKLAEMFKTAFSRFEAECSPEVVAAGPVV